MAKKRLAPRGIFSSNPEQGAVSSLVDYKKAHNFAKLLHEMLQGANRPLGMDEILRILRLPRKAKKKTEDALYSLQQEGYAVRSGGAWVALSRLRRVEGVLFVLRSGMGFVTSNGAGEKVISIHPSSMGDAWPGDTVEALVLPGKRASNREGKILRVLRRAWQELPAQALKLQQDTLWSCAPDNTRIPALFLADVSELAHPVHEGDTLLIAPQAKIAPRLWSAKATAHLGGEDSPKIQERITKSRYAIPGFFPLAVLQEAAALPVDPTEMDIAARRDLGDVPFVTIDGLTARDFDDAVHVERARQGFRLRVAIADVSHYVPQGSALDAEARLRGNSCYFPLSVEPMLPEALSNGLCSLLPLRPRLVVVADMFFDNAGKRTQTALYTAVIKSRARLAYEQIERGLFLHEEVEKRNLAPHLPMLREAEKLACSLVILRAERGALALDMPEAEIVFDIQGGIRGIEPRQRHMGHRMIEEFMIAANEAVASFLEEAGQSFLYRVHEPPDPEKLHSLAVFLDGLGLEKTSFSPTRGRKKLTPALIGHELRRILGAVAGTPSEYMITRLVVRSLMQAHYSPDNEGHFGLASKSYCHFTSPIRRYADLVVHRVLKCALCNAEQPTGTAHPEKERPLSYASLQKIAGHISDTERNAAEAERDIHKRLVILYLRGKVGATYHGIISWVTEFGFFVEIEELRVEGLVRLANLADDYYEYLPEPQELRGRHTGSAFRLGQKVRVVLTDVNLARLEVNLMLQATALETRDAKTGIPGAKRKREKTGRGRRRNRCEKV